MMQDILESGKKLRVAAYCRVSTAKEEQESSYETQVAFFKAIIAYHPNWEMTEVYADYGITGTSVEKRKGFSRMIEDCKAGKNRSDTGKIIKPFCKKYPGFFKLYSYAGRKEI